MAEEVVATAAENESAKFDFKNLIPKILPILALVGAGLSLIFTFLIGVSSTAEGLPDYFIYHFFDGKYIGSITSIQGMASWKAANVTVMVAGMIITIVGLIAVLTFTGFTVFKAVRRYKFKDNSSVEQFSLLTYLSYILFSSLFYALNCVYFTNENIAGRTNYNGATIAGIVVTSIVFAAYFALKGIEKSSYLKNKLNIIRFSFSLARIAFIAVFLGLLSAPFITVTCDNLEIKSNFIQLLINGTLGGDADKLNSLSSASVAGILVVSAASVLLAWLLFDNLSNLFAKKKKNDSVFYCFLIIFQICLQKRKRTIPSSIS